MYTVSSGILLSEQTRFNLTIVFVFKLFRVLTLLLVELNSSSITTKDDKNSAIIKDDEFTGIMKDDMEKNQGLIKFYESCTSIIEKIWRTPF